MRIESNANWSPTQKDICYYSYKVAYDFLKFCSYYVPISLTQPLAQAKNGDQ
jgi:hypothetical protein